MHTDLYGFIHDLNEGQRIYTDLQRIYKDLYEDRLIYKIYMDLPKIYSKPNGCIRI